MLHLESFCPLARGAHFLFSAFAGLAVYWLISRICSDRTMCPLSQLSRWAFALSAACTAHYVLDVFFKVP